MMEKWMRISGGNFRVTILGALILVMACLSHPARVSAEVESMAAEIVGCDTSITTDYSEGFDAEDFDFTNVEVDENGDIILQTGNQAINPNAVKIPFTQDVKVTFLYEGAGHKSDFGWMLYEDAVNDDGTFKGWNNISLDKKHPVFVNIDSDGSGRLKNSLTATDVLPLNNDEQLAAWNDGTGLPFIVEDDDDLNVTYKDMTKSLGTFAGGQELVFFLTDDRRYTTTNQDYVFFNKTSWNNDSWTTNCVPSTSDSEWWLDSPANTKFIKRYLLDEPGGERCQLNYGWLTQSAIDRIEGYATKPDGTPKLQLSGHKDLTLLINGAAGTFPHVIVGAPDASPNQWILGWEDLRGGGDTDHNDLVFLIDRDTGGTAQLQASQALVPATEGAYFTAATIEVYDYIPCPNQAVNIRYYLSIDGGENWVEIIDWDHVEQIDEDGNFLNPRAVIAPSDWKIEDENTPRYTYRTSRFDFVSRNLSGNQLVWKAEMISDDEDCVPKILDVHITGTVANHAMISHSSPIVQVNMVYSGSYETPAIGWPMDERWYRGHLTATRVYMPDQPTNENGSATNASVMWDAGTKLAAMSNDAFSQRKIYYPDFTYGSVTADAPEVVGVGDGTIKTFKGTLSNTIIQAGSVFITDGNETYIDKHTDRLMGTGSSLGTGTINRFTGELEITFHEAPAEGSQIKVTYRYYSPGELALFNTTNVNSQMLNLNNEFIHGEGYTYDFDGDGAFESDEDAAYLVNWVRGYKDGGSTRKAWPLGAIDHSAPAVDIAPGYPSWYESLKGTREGYLYEGFVETHKNRPTVIYVGARDGMLHAFDAGKFRWGGENNFPRGDNPKTTDITEYRGYFEWSGDTAGTADYGTGNELWAFIPANLIPKLKNNLMGTSNQAYVDASPAIADVYINKAWKSIVISAQGEGGDSVFCLDVTNPAAPAFMWEFTDPDLFKSKSSPAIARIGRVLIDNETRWVAFFVSGHSPSCGGDNDDQHCYPSIFMIDIADGSVIARIFLDSAVAGKGGIPSGQPAVIDYDDNGYLDRLYVGTDKGLMYKVNIPDTQGTIGDIDDCVINGDFATDGGSTVPQASQYQPIYASPTVLKDGSGNIKIFYGTGDSPYVKEGDYTAGTQYNFFAYIDSDGKGQCTTANLEWFLELPAGHRVFASAFAAAGKIYFGTSTSDTEDPCESYNPNDDGANKGRLYILNQDGSVPAELPEGSPYIETGDLRVTPVVEDEHIYFKSPTSSVSDANGGVTSIGDGQYNNEPLHVGKTEVNEVWWREVIEE